jgi:gamma-glutamylputrescine oxidase
VEHIPGDLKAWNRTLMLKIFPYLKDVKIDLAWGGPMACSPNLFPQVGTLPGRSNAFFVQGREAEVVFLGGGVIRRGFDVDHGAA